MLKFIQQQIFPGLYADYCNKKVSKIYNKQKKADVNIAEINSEKDDYILKLKNEIEQQIERKIKLEDKAKSLLFIITLAITIITFSLTYIKENTYHLLPIIFIVLSIIHFIISGIRALQTLNIKEFNIHQANIKFKENEFILKKDKKPSLLLKELIKSKSLNDLINLKTSNYTFASFILIRNGLIFFVFFFVLSISKSFNVNETDSKVQTESEVQTESKVRTEQVIESKIIEKDTIKELELNELEKK